MTARTLTADRGDAGVRLDLVLRRHLSDVDAATRTRVQAWIERGQVSVNGRAVRRVSARAAFGDVVEVMLPDAPPKRVMAAEERAIQILYEDDLLLAIDKPAGLVVHPAFRNATGTLMNALLWHAREWPDDRRPSLVGRLDKLTSGIVIVAKSADAHAALQRALASESAEKEYLAIVYGRVTVAKGQIARPLAVDPFDRRRMIVSAGNGAPSVTRFVRVARARASRAGLALLRCRLVTGRRHQIRAHLQSQGWPIVGDAVYGEPRWRDVADTALAAALRAFPRQALHAARVSLRHPVTGERLTIQAPLPADMRELIHRAFETRLDS